MSKTPLCLLAEKYGSDKFSAKHSYTRWYYDTFAARRASVRKVVEIGVGEGASLRMWREFFHNAMIYGMDNDPARCVCDERIEVVKGDQAKGADLLSLALRVGTDVDLFVDDGSHRLCDQMLTCYSLMPMLWRSVIYVIEDVDTAGAEQFSRETLYDFKVPELEPRKRYDNRLVVATYPNV